MPKWRIQEATTTYHDTYEVEADTKEAALDLHNTGESTVVFGVSESEIIGVKRIDDA